MITIPNINCNDISSGQTACTNFNRVIDYMNTLAGAITYASTVTIQARSPLNTDDISHGFKKGSVWIDENPTPSKIYMSSSDENGNAVWKLVSSDVVELTETNSDPTPSNTGNIGDMWINTDTSLIFMLTNSGWKPFDGIETPILFDRDANLSSIMGTNRVNLSDTRITSSFYDVVQLNVGINIQDDMTWKVYLPDDSEDGFLYSEVGGSPISTLNVGKHDIISIQKEAGQWILRDGFTANKIVRGVETAVNVVDDGSGNKVTTYSIDCTENLKVGDTLTFKPSQNNAVGGAGDTVGIILDITNFTNNVEIKINNSTDIGRQTLVEKDNQCSVKITSLFAGFIDPKVPIAPQGGVPATRDNGEPLIFGDMYCREMPANGLELRVFNNGAWLTYFSV